MTYPATPLNIQWPRLDPRTYEDMVSVLLSTMNPDVIRTDGSGGDGGRDVHFNAPDGLEIFELKSFTGRFTANRQKQVKNSFNRAKLLKPKKWTVVCPINLTKAERDKFEKIVADSEIECTWRDQTWLDARMVEHPGVARYFLSDVNNEVRELAALFGQEQAALANGVPDAVARVRALAERCDELDPYYRIDLATDSSTGSASATLVPRYPGAERDRPITLQATVVFPDDEAAAEAEAQFQASRDFGEGFEIASEYVQRVVVDAPAGLGGEFGGGQIVVGPKEVGKTPEFRIQIIITDPGGTAITMLPLSGKAKTGGERGIVADLADDAGLLSVEMRLDWTESKMSFNYHFSPQPGLPAAVLPALRFLQALRTPNFYYCQMPNGTALGPPAEITIDGANIDDRVVQTVELLARVQEATATWFDVPDEFSESDLEALVMADRLLQGEIVSGTWGRYATQMTPEHASTMLETLTELSGSPSAAISLWHRSDQSLIIAGHEMPLGETTSILHSACLRDPQAVIAAVDAGEVVEFEYVPANANTYETWRGGPEDRPT